MKYIVTILIFFSISLYSEEYEFLLYEPSPGNEGQYLDFIYNNAGTEKSHLAFIALQRLTANLLRERDFDAAKAMYEEFKSDFPGMEDRFNKTIEILEEPRYNLEEINLGNNINSEYSEYSPVPNGDESRLYFTGYGRSRNNKTEDVFMSEYKNGRWQPAEKLQGKINSDENMEAPQCITTDDNTLIFFGNLEGSLGRGDLFYSERVSDTEWGEVKHYPRPINSEYFDCDAKITNNGDAIIFVSDRPGGIGEYKPYGEFFNGSMHGNTDIYVSERTDTGWSAPINLGDKINTPYAERKPFFHPDGKSLYFSSNGHAGLGRLDLYKVEKLNEDSWTEWSEPINFGKQINSPNDERAAIVNTFGHLAYFATADRDVSFGKSDIFTISLPEHLRPDPVAIIKGTVKDVEGNPLDAKILWEDLQKGKKIGEMKSNPETGKYLIIFPMGKNYGFYADKKGYFPISKNLDLTEESDSMIVEQDIIMYPIDYLLGGDIDVKDKSLDFDVDVSETDRKLRINNLFFNYNEAKVLEASYLELDRVAYLLKEYPEIKKVEIEGHSDSIGGERYNLDLSQKRAEKVMEYLIQKGIGEERLVAKGYGKSVPVATNETEEGRQQNRRVEMRILETAGRSEE